MRLPLSLFFLYSSTIVLRLMHVAGTCTVRLDCLRMVVLLHELLCQDDQLVVHPLTTPGSYQYQHNGIEHLYQPVQSPRHCMDPL